MSSTTSHSRIEFPAGAHARGLTLGLAISSAITAVAVYFTQAAAHHITQSSTVAILAAGAAFSLAVLTHVPVIVTGRDRT